MKVAAVTCDRPIARLIRWGLGEPASHLALVFDDGIVHATLAEGVHLTLPAAFFAEYRIVDSVDFPLPGREAALRAKTEELIGGEGYDQSAFASFCWMAFKRKAFGVPLPAVNPGDDPGKSICCEALYGFLEAWAIITGKTITLSRKTWGASTPMECVAALKESTR